MEETEKTKPWEKPWTTDDLRKECGNWSLAGDAGLLNHLQQFSQNLLQKTHATQVSLDKLIEDLKTTSTEISNVTNSFLSLANTQFVENRVYDDDENEVSSEEKKEDEKVKSKSQLEAEVVGRIKEALAKGMALLESHFDAVDVPASDSEEDESLASTGRVILEARNTYMVRPLPYLIGSKEFIEDDHVGLGELQSDTEESPDQNLMLSSESEDELERGESGTIPKRLRLSSSSMSENSEPESDRSGTQGKQKKHKPGSSHLGSVDALEEESDMFGRESPPEADISQRSVRNNFAEELADKLGGVVAKTSTSQREEKDISDNIFSPPPDHEDESLFGPQARKFSGGHGLFDDLDDWSPPRDSLWGNDDSTTTQKKKDKASRGQPGDISDSLFNADSESSDLFRRGSSGQIEEEGDIFSTGTKRNRTSAIPKQLRIPPIDGGVEQNVITSMPTEISAPGKLSSHGLFDDAEIDDLFDNETVSNKAGMPEIPKSSSLFDSTDMDDGDLFSIPTASNIKDKKTLPTNQQHDTPKKKIPAGGVNVFGNVDLSRSKLSPIVPYPSSTESMPEESSGSVPVSTNSASGVGKSQELNAGIIASSQTSGPSSNTAGKISLFDSEEDHLFQIPDPSTQTSIHEEDGNDSIFHRPDAVSKSSAGGLIPGISKQGIKDRKPVSLFDESDSGDDEILFSSTSSTSSRSRRSQGSGDLLAGEKKTLQKKGLFDNDNILFGSSQTDDPGFDIFSTDSSIKNNTNSVSKLVPETNTSPSGLFNDNTSKTKKVSYGLFDGFSDPSEDIFAIPAHTEDAAIQKPDNTLKEALKSNLFLDSDDVDIFQITVPRVNDNVLKDTDYASEKSDLLSNKVHCDNKFISSIPIDKSSRSPSTAPINHNEGSKLGVTLFDSVENRKEVEQEKKSDVSSESANTINKPRIGQKPKITATKPSLFEPSSEEKHISNINNTQNETPPESVKSEPKNEVVNSDTREVKTVQEIKSNSEVQTVTKPEPPRTLNIRKTTDLFFNNEEDLWTTGSLDEKDNVPDFHLCNENTLKQDTLSAIFQDSASVSRKISLEPGKIADSVDGSMISIAKQPKSMKEISPKSVSTTAKEDAVMPVKVKSLTPTPSTLSPIKLMIDPTALLPGANPPTKAVHAEGGVSFDKPVDTNTVLHSASKERAKIQVKRRPQSRRARQEAIRVSSLDLDNGIDINEQEELIEKKKSSDNGAAVHDSLSNKQDESNSIPPKQEIDSERYAQVVSPNKNLMKEKGKDVSISDSVNFFSTPPDVVSKLSSSDFLDGNSNPLSPSTDEEDFFAVPQDLPSEYSNTKHQASNERENLFSCVSVLSPVDLPSQEIQKSDDIDSHTHSISADLFHSSSGQHSEPSGPPKVVSQSKTDLFSNTEAPLDKKYTGLRNPLDKASVELDDDYDLFDSNLMRDNSQRSFLSDEDLFGTAQLEHKTSPLSSKLDVSNSGITDILNSITTESLFTSQDDNSTFMHSRTSVAADSRDLLFSPTEDNSKHFLSNKNGEVSEVSVPKITSNDLFSSMVQEEYSSSKECLETPKDQSDENDLFPPLPKNVIPKINSNKESVDILFSKKVVSGITQRTSATGVVQTSSLFGDDSPESDDLFASSIITSKRKISSEMLKESVSGRNSLFEDSDDNLFGTSSVKSALKQPSSSALETKHNLGMSDEEADLFSSSTKKTVAKPIQKPIPASHGHRKDDLFEDPLMVIKK